MKKRILVVEDEKAYIKLISLELEKERYYVVPASTIKEARSKIRSSLPDFIILDIQLPDGADYRSCPC